MGASSGKNVKSLIIKIIICLFLVIGLLLIESSFGYSKMPINRMTLNQTKDDIKSKMQQVINMDTKISEISQKAPELVKNADKLTNNALLGINKQRGNVTDIPAILVYLEQTGKNAGLVVKKIDIEGLDNTGKSVENSNQNNYANKLIITAAGSYKGFCDYIKEIQINTKEKITIEGFKFTSIDGAMSNCKAVIEISL
ncbi:MAG: hypothetical protein ACM3KR_01855 [Deltaproteobacteria bacterium]